MLNIITRFRKGEVNKEVLSRVLLVVMFLLVAWVAGSFVLENMGLVVASILAVGLTLTSSLPRWILLWYEQRSILIELTFSVTAWWLSGGVGGFGLVSFMFTAAAAVSVIKLINYRWAKSHRHTLYQWLSKGRWHWLFAKDPSPLPEDWYWPQDEEGAFLRQGWLDWRYVAGHLRHRGEEGYSYFGDNSRRPQKPSWWLLVRSHRRYVEQMEEFYDLTSRNQRISEIDRELRKLHADLKEKAKNKPEEGLEGWIQNLASLQGLINQLVAEKATL